MDLLPPMPRLFDISLPISPAMPVWPGDPSPILEPVTTMEDHGVRVSRLVLGTHTGTHLDAPSHFIPRGRSIDQLDLEALVGPCYVLDVGGDGGPLPRSAIASCELRPGARVLLKTANSRRPTAAGFRPDFVALEADAAAYLRDCRVRLVGIDGPSVDAWDSADFPCHKQLLAADILIVENLVLRHVEPGKYGLVAVPLNLVGADGCPVRAFLTAGPTPCS
jgi:arylformamidase